MATVMAALDEGTVLPTLSWTATLGGPLIAPLVVELAGWNMKASLVGLPATTLKGALSPAVRASPVVALAVSTTPKSFFE
jgi:hypothetical protein